MSIENVVFVIVILALVTVGLWGRRPRPMRPRGRMSDQWRRDQIHNGWRDQARMETPLS